MVHSEMHIASYRLHGAKKFRLIFYYYYYIFFYKHANFVLSVVKRRCPPHRRPSANRNRCTASTTPTAPSVRSTKAYVRRGGQASMTTPSISYEVYSTLGGVSGQHDAAIAHTTRSLPRQLLDAFCQVERRRSGGAG